MNFFDMAKRVLGLGVFVMSIMTSPSAQAGIPVIDGANLAQSVQQVISWGQQAQQMAQQIQTQIQQLQQAQQMFESMNGMRGMAGLLQNPALKNYLPSDWQQVYSGVMSGQYSGISGAAQDIMNATKIVAGMESQLRQFSVNKAATDKAMGMQAFSMMQQRLQQLLGLTQAIDSATDPKAIADLQARIAGEQAAIQNEQTKLHLMAVLQQNEERLMAAQQEAAFHDRMKQTGDIPALRVQ
jgi:type IV secretion system protein VirB5